MMEGRPSTVPIAVLCSGSGTNLQALLDAAGRPGSAFHVAVVLADRPAAFALERARRAGVPDRVVLLRDHADRDAFDAAVAEVLRGAGVAWVCLAGWLKQVGRPLLDAFPERILNIHPSLLPAFPGLHAQQQAWEAGVRIAGCTVHLVDRGLDTGPIVAQAAVPVLPTDDAEALRLRILAEEHVIYPLAVQWAAEGRLRIDGRRVALGGDLTAARLTPP